MYIAGLLRTARAATCQLLCCSDGLHNMLSDKRIESILKQRKSIEHKVEQLINESNQAGGYDNITVTLAWKVK